ncbi:MAG: AI-2E family transporter [Chloroflexi bacterium]|nr:AI-2E family transporter [Chloroflexota bacterium]
MDNNWSKSFRYVMMTTLVLILFMVGWYIRAAVGPLVIGALLAYVLNPVKNLLAERTRLSHSLSATTVLIIAFGLLAALSAFILPALVKEFQFLVQDLERVVTPVTEFLARPILLFEYEFYLGSLIPDPALWISESAQRITENAFHLIEVITENLLWLLVTFVTMYYLLRDWSRLRDWLLSLPPKPYQPDINRIYQEIRQIWRGYLRGNIALMTVVGIVFTIAWLALGVPGALILGTIAGLLTIIPDLGPAIAALLAAIVAFIEGSTYLPLSNFWFAVLVLGVYLGLINIKNLWLRPRIFGRSVHMHEGIVFIAIIIAVLIGGILGALIIIPVLASAGIIGRYIYNRALGLPPWPDIPSYITSE